MLRHNEVLQIVEFDPHRNGEMCRYVIRRGRDNSIIQACITWLESASDIPCDAEAVLNKNTSVELVSVIRERSNQGDVVIIASRKVVE